MSKATTKKATSKKAAAKKVATEVDVKEPVRGKVDEPSEGHLNTGVDGQPTADTFDPAPEDKPTEDPDPQEPIAPADEFGQPTEQKKVDQSPNVEHPTVAPGNEEAAEPLHNPELVEEHANQISHVVGTEQTKDHSDPSEVAHAALADPDVPLGQDADPNGPDDLRSE